LKKEGAGMGFIDCDSHILENDSTWDHLPPDDEKFRPLKVQRAGERDHTGVGVPLKNIWLFNDEWTHIFDAAGVNKPGQGHLYDPGVTSLSSAGSRVEDLDVLGIDVQLIFGTVFLTTEVEHPLAESALKRCWNRWAAERASSGVGRLRWVAEVPTRTMTCALDEVEFAKSHGAGGIHLHGVQHGYYLDDPYFYPLYERCRALDLPILVHVGMPQRNIANFPIGNSMPSAAVFLHHVAAVMAGFYAVLTSDLQVRFPGLRWGFMEAGASWAISLLHQAARKDSMTRDFRSVPIAPEVLEEKGIFIACETDENLPELIRVVGENVLVTGTDYAHNDKGTELDAHRTILDRTDISRSAARKIVDANGRRLLAVPSDFQPSDAARAATENRELHIQPAALAR
jgi:predicted TIM-barrel fold metal-dependent hydrolase